MLFQHVVPVFGGGVNHRERLAFQCLRLHADQMAKGIVDGDNDAFFIGQPHPVTEFSQTERKSVSELCRAASASRRSVMSRTCNSTAALPPYSMRLARTSTGVIRPSAVRLSLSAWVHLPLAIFSKSCRACSRRDSGTRSVKRFLPINCSARQAVQHTGGKIHVQHHAIQVLHKNGVGRIFKQIAKAPLAFAQCLLGVDAFQRAAALIGQGLEHFQIVVGVGAGHVVLDEQARR